MIGIMVTVIALAYGLDCMTPEYCMADDVWIAAMAMAQ